MPSTHALRFAPLLLLLAIHPVEAAPSRPLDSQVKLLARDLRDVLTTDPKLKGRTVRLGLFPGPALPTTNFGSRIRRQLEAELKDLLGDKAALTVTGRYDFVESDTDTPQEDDKFKLQVIRIKAVIEDDKAREQAVKYVEVNETDDIAAALGLTVSPGLHDGQKKRNEAVKKAHDTPTFVVKGGTRVGVKDSPFFVEILIKNTPNGPATPAEPANHKGQVFVDIKEKEFYEIKLYNEADFEAAASIVIDGLDALNTFNKDPRKYGHYIIPAKGSVTIRGWLQTTDRKVKDNVLSFLVTEYGHGAATAFKSTGEVGVITVAFHAAWKDGANPPPSEKGVRSVGRETTAGPAIPNPVEVVKRHIGLKRATVSIRYSPNP